MRDEFVGVGIKYNPSVALFVSEELAKGAMRSQFDMMMLYQEAKGDDRNPVAFSLDPHEHGESDTCYIKLKDGRESRWNVTKVDIFQK